MTRRPAPVDGVVNYSAPKRQRNDLSNSTSDEEQKEKHQQLVNDTVKELIDNYKDEEGRVLKQLSRNVNMKLCEKRAIKEFSELIEMTKNATVSKPQKPLLRKVFTKPIVIVSKSDLVVEDARIKQAELAILKFQETIRQLSLECEATLKSFS